MSEKDIRKENGKVTLDLDELEKVTGGTGATPKKEPTPISPGTKDKV